MTNRKTYASDTTASEFGLGPATTPEAAQTLDSLITINVSASFTAEPIEKCLRFWLRKLGIPFRIQFAPYGQVFQQLLDPSRFEKTNSDEVNVILVRLEDWNRNLGFLAPVVAPSEQERILAGRSRYTLPNHADIAHLNKHETDYVYREIFVDQVYARNGIVLRDDSVVIDAGANIGLFTLFIHDRCKSPTVYAFEPAPPVFDILQANTAVYGKNVKLFHCGLSNRNEKTPFRYYPRSSVMSGFCTDVAEDGKTLQKVINNRLQQDPTSEAIDEGMSDWLVSEEYIAELRTLSSVIRENNIARIDLLKIDVEKSESYVLEGIDDDHWPLIGQIVAEVHDHDGRQLEAFVSRLKEKRFHVVVTVDEHSKDAGLYNVYATREAQYDRPSGPATTGSQQVEQHVRDLGLALATSAEHSRTPHLVCLCPSSPDALNDNDGRASVDDLEHVLSEQTAALSDVYLLSSSEVLNTYPVDEPYDAHADKLGHIPYTPTYFTALGTTIARRVHAIKSAPYKVIVLDCDHTLWAGICGEDGTTGIKIDAPHRFLQEFMVRQYDAGMLICLCSKNNEDDVCEVFEYRTEMPLRREHIVAWRINWQPKSANLKSLAEELQVGLDSFVFVDDSPLECAEVQAACPEVLTLQLPEDSESIPQFLQNVWAFDHLKPTDEDKNRTTLYKQNVARHHFQAESLSLDAFFSGLELEVQISEMASQQFGRVAQLTQRTNQFNATTVRYTEGAIRERCQSTETPCLVVDVSDRFGDYGLVGVMIFGIASDALSIDSFLLSCRALGRGVEYQMVARLGRVAKSCGLEWVEIPYIASKRNQPILEFLNRIAQPFSQPTEFGLLFRLPADFAADLTYQPISIQNERSNGSRIGAPAPERTPAVRLEKEKSPLAEIATELCDAATIHMAIESQEQRHRPGLESDFVAPRTPLETSLIDIWARVLGIRKVGVRDDFFALGGDSLRAVTMLADVKAVTQRILPLTAVFQAPTVEKLAAIVGQKDWSPDWSSLVPLQPHGSKPPFFFVSGSRNHFGGRLGSDQPVYRLQIQDLDRDQRFTRAEDMAAHCIAEMRRLQPEGPYFIGGHCFGGVVAFEMAQQLKSLDQQVAILVLMDSEAPRSDKAIPQNPIGKRILQRIRYHFSRARRFGPKVELGRLSKQVRKRSRQKLWRLIWKLNPTSGPVARMLQDPRAANLKANEDYVPQVYPGQLILFKANERIPWKIQDSKKGWGHLASEGVEVYELPCLHTAMYQEPHVLVLAERLSSYLADAQSASRRTVAPADSTRRDRDDPGDEACHGRHSGHPPRQATLVK